MSLCSYKNTPARECIICGGPLNITANKVFDTRFGINDHYNICFCRNCGLEQTSEIPSGEVLETYYNEFYNFSGQTSKIYSDIRRWFLSSIFYRIWIIIDGDISFHGYKNKGRLIDIGCNEGRGLTIYKKNGFEVEGLEPNKNAAKKARKKGHKVYTEQLNNFHPKLVYDVAVLSNVLEHSLQPEKVLSHISRILRPKGFLLISCPHSKSWQRTIFGRYWVNWHVPFHIFHFSRKALSKIINEAGFRIIEERQESPSLWMAQSLIARLFAKQGHATTIMRKTVLIASFMLVIRFLAFPLLWVGNISGRGDCLLVVAEKI